jgi:hypothetical protein
LEVPAIVLKATRQPYHRAGTIHLLLEFARKRYFLNRNKGHDMQQNHPRQRPSSEAAVTAPRVREEEGSREGHMGAIRVFVVLSWAVFALRQILLRPVEVLVRKDSSR